MIGRLIRGIRRADAGFTLIELMIVILVILILASILVPQFGLARERARKAQCVSNQRNIETAVAMWQTDNQGLNYTGGQLNVATPNTTTLTGLPQVYALAAVFVEPDDTTVTNGSDYWLSQGSASGAANTSAPSYGHVACWYDGVADAWVAGYDGTAGGGKGTGINHTRGISASP